MKYQMYCHLDMCVAKEIEADNYEKAEQEMENFVEALDPSELVDKGSPQIGEIWST